MLSFNSVLPQSAAQWPPCMQNTFFIYNAPHFSDNLYAIMSVTGSQVICLAPPCVDVQLPALNWDNAGSSFIMPLFNGKGIANCQARDNRRCKRLVLGDTEWQEMPSCIYSSGWSWSAAMHFGAKSLYMGVWADNTGRLISLVQILVHSTLT